MIGSCSNWLVNHPSRTRPWPMPRRRTPASRRPQAACVWGCCRRWRGLTRRCLAQRWHRWHHGVGRMVGTGWGEERNGEKWWLYVVSKDFQRVFEEKTWTKYERIGFENGNLRFIEENMCNSRRKPKEYADTNRWFQQHNSGKWHDLQI